MDLCDRVGALAVSVSARDSAMRSALSSVRPGAVGGHTGLTDRAGQTAPSVGDTRYMKTKIGKFRTDKFDT